MNEIPDLVEIQELRRARRLSLEAVSSIVFHDLNQPLTYLLANAMRFRQLSPAIATIKKLLTANGSSLNQKECQNLAEICEDYEEIFEELHGECAKIRYQFAGERASSHSNGRSHVPEAATLRKQIESGCNPYKQDSTD